MSDTHEKRCYVLVHNDVAASHDKMKVVLNSIVEIETWRTDIPNCFYIVSKKDASQLSKLIRSRIANQGRFLVSEITSNRQGWLTPESWYLINHHRLKPADKA